LTSCPARISTAPQRPLGGPPLDTLDSCTRYSIGFRQHAQRVPSGPTLPDRLLLLRVKWLSVPVEKGPPSDRGPFLIARISVASRHRSTQRVDPRQ
jgi:hypothetical protein